MPITHLEIDGYRSLRKVAWFPGDLNVVIGPNGAGKSNILKILRLIQTCATGRMAEYVLSEGGMGAITWNGIERAIRFVVSGKSGENESELFDYSASLKRIGVSASYLIDDELLTSHTLEGNVLTSRPTVIRRSEAAASVQTGEQAVDFTPADMDSDEALLSQLKGPYSSGLVREFAAMVDSWAIHDNFHTEAGAEIRRPTTSRHEERLENDGQNLTAVLHTHYESDSEFRYYVDLAMRAAFGEEFEGLSFPPAGSQQIELGVRWKSLKRPQTPPSLSDGTLRFLFLVTALSQPNPPALIAIDEPETGLHPSMMRIVTEYAEDAALRSQVIFTTHSAAFLDGFRKDRPPTTTVASTEEGETRLTLVDPAQLNYWLKEYSLGTLYRSRELEQMEAASPSQEDGI